MFNRAIKTVLILVLAAPHSLCSTLAEDNGVQFRAVVSQYDAGNYDRAKHLAESLIAGHPRNLTAHYLLGNICVKLNQIAQAEAAYKDCLRGAKNSPEAIYARKALQQISNQRRMRAVQSPALAAAPAFPMAGMNHSADEKIQEETARLLQESKDRIAIKKRSFDDHVAQIKQDQSQAMYNAPRGRRGAFYRQDYQNQVKTDAQGRIDKLTKEFEREKSDITQACQKRIDELTEYEHNIESRGMRR
ncbi:MAG: tetratricopeptide repeat protein [Cyanobacteria bacterium REEB67]|nr:tetratricopeptide repeat protein [Cyanobacteria bacterium REEB67]